MSSNENQTDLSQWHKLRDLLVKIRSKQDGFLKPVGSPMRFIKLKFPVKFFAEMFPTSMLK